MRQHRSSVRFARSLRRARDRRLARQRTPGKLQKRGQYWYELKATFSEDDKELLPIEDSGYMLGVLEDIIVIEVEKATPQEQIARIGKWLADQGMKALVVEKGVRFLKLCAVSKDQEAKLNELERHRRLQETLAEAKKAGGDGEAS